MSRKLLVILVHGHDGVTLLLHVIVLLGLQLLHAVLVAAELLPLLHLLVLFKRNCGSATCISISVLRHRSRSRRAPYLFATSARRRSSFWPRRGFAKAVGRCRGHRRA